MEEKDYKSVNEKENKDAGAKNITAKNIDKEKLSNINDPADKKDEYFKDYGDNLEDRRTGETYDKDRIEGFFETPPKEQEEKATILDIRDNRREKTDEHITKDKKTNKENDEKLSPSGNEIPKDKVNRQNNDLSEENRKAKDKAGDDYNKK